MDVQQTLKAVNSSRPVPVLHELGWFADTPLVRAADRIFGEHADIGLALAIAVALPFLRGALDHFLFKPAGKLMICGRRQRPSAAQKSLIYKWKESNWKAFMYLSMAIAAFASSRDQQWFTRSRAMWEGCSRIPCDYDVPKGVRLVYCLEMGHYLQAIPTLLFWEVRRKDFAESLAHHVATLVLIMYSYYINVTKVGAVVFMLHDINDIFLELAKMFRYARAPALPNICFAAFVASWIVTRLAIFPNWVIRSTLFDTMAIARHLGVNIHPHYEIFNGLLIMLLILHIYWTWLIVKVLTKVLKGSMAQDVREADDDSDEELMKQSDAELAAAAAKED